MVQFCRYTAKENMEPDYNILCLKSERFLVSLQKCKRSIQPQITRNGERSP